MSKPITPPIREHKDVTPPMRVHKDVTPFMRVWKVEARGYRHLVLL